MAEAPAATGLGAVIMYLATKPEDEHRVGDYRANYRLPTPEKLHAPNPELDELFKNSIPIRR
jgi:hypothetical protein